MLQDEVNMVAAATEQTSVPYHLNILTIGIFNLPKSWISYSSVIDTLKTVNISYLNVTFIDTSAMVLKNSCHVCLAQYKELHNQDYCVLLSCEVENFEENQISSKLKEIFPETSTKMICQAKFADDMSCPLVVEQKLIQKLRECNVADVVERWFSDEEIFNHRDMLVAMNDGGWVPLSLVSNKLQETVDVSEAVLAARLSQSASLVVDEQSLSVRRLDPRLPETIESRQLVLLDVPASVKSVRQLHSVFPDEGAVPSAFDHGSHSGLVTFPSREAALEAAAVTDRPGGLQTRLLVPEMGRDEAGQAAMTTTRETVALPLLAPRASPLASTIHVGRLAPADLAYEWPPAFAPPSPSMIGQLVAQADFYFGDRNILRDLFLLKKVRSSPGGWVSVATVAAFQRMARLSGGSEAAVVYALTQSDQLQLSRDGRSVRRRLPLPAWDPSVYTRSLFLWALPAACQDHEWLEAAFQAEARLPLEHARLIKAGRNVPADLRRLQDRVRALGTRDCAVLEFRTREAVLAAETYAHARWPSVGTFVLDSKAELPKPAVIVERPSRRLPPPIPVCCGGEADEAAPVASLQAGTRIDPRFWQAVRTFVVDRQSMTAPTAMAPPKTSSLRDFPPLDRPVLAGNREPARPRANRGRSKPGPRKGAPKENSQPLI